MYTPHLCRTGSALVFTRATVLLNLIPGELLQCTNTCIPSVRNSHWYRYRILDKQRCVFIVCCTQSNEHPCRYGWTAMTSVRDTSLSGVDAVSSLDHTNGPERIWCCSNAFVWLGTDFDGEVTLSNLLPH